MEDKIIVTNQNRLTTKYDKEGFKAIAQALKALTAEDKNRGINSKVVYLDGKVDMKKIGSRR